MRVNVSGVKKPYEIVIGNGILESLPKELGVVTKSKRAVIVTDDNVDKIYGETVCDLLRKGGFEVDKFVFCHGEENKSMETVNEILEFLAEKNITRSDFLIALGGGVTGDVTGFCAASYLRGIDFVQLPTTFLAAIDSSVGGKTGVNLKAGKNLAGAFHQPILVMCDTSFLKTLPERNFKEGTAEALKYGVICDKDLFYSIGDNTYDIEKIIGRCVEIKSKIVSEDEFDKGTRQLLNLGHTIGHAIEKCSDFEISHGEAVAIGMAMIAKSAKNMGFAESKCFEEIIRVLKNMGLPTECGFKPLELVNVMKNDKKRTGDSITLVIPKNIGESVLKKVPVSELDEIVKNAY